MGQQQKRRPPLQTKFPRTLCFRFGTTSVQVRQVEACLRAAQKNGDLPKSPLVSIGSTGAIGKHNPKF